MAQPGAVEAAFARRLVDQPLDDVDRLGIARPAADADRRGVGQHRRDIQLDRRDAIDGAGQKGILKRLHAAGAARQIRPEIGGAVDPQRQKPARPIERQRRIRHMVARLMVGEKHLAAAGDPLDRASDAFRRP